MHLSHSFTILVLLATAASVSAQCSFTAPPGLTRWGGTISQVEACFNTVPLVTAAHNKVISNVGKALEAHAFSDIASANLSPYNMNVDVSGTWATIAGTTYTNDWAPQKDIISLFNSLGDAHLVYWAPEGYGNFYYYAPFALLSRWVGGQQRVYVEAGAYTSAAWDLVCGCSDNIGQYYGEEVTQINGIPILDYLAAFGTLQGVYTDYGVRIQNALYWQGYAIYFHSNALPGSNSISYTLATSGTVSFDYIANAYDPITSVDDIVGLNARTVKRDGYGQEAAHSIELRLLAAIETELGRTSLARDALTLRLREKAAAAAAEIRSLHAASSEYGRVLAAEINKRDFNMEEFSSKNYAPLPHVRMQRVRDFDAALLDLQYDVDREAIRASTRAKIDASIEKQYGARHVASDIAGVDARRAAKGGTAVTKPVLSGNPTLFSNIYTGGAARSRLYNNTVVLQLDSFSDNGFRPSVQQAHSGRGTATNLIIDVSNNGGGLVCLNFGTLNYLIGPWRADEQAGVDVLYSPYDWRRSDLTDVLFEEDQFYWSFVDTQRNPQTGALMNNAQLLAARDITYGSHTSTYSQLFNWNPGCSDSIYYYLDANNYVFDKIIILTDGRCGSSCAYFTSHLRWANKVRVVSFGGDAASPLATSSFAGGNVWRWDNLVARALSVASPYATAAGLQYFDSNAYLSFNMRANYDPDGVVPRQFERLEADWYLPTWDFLYYDFSDDGLRADLYSSVIPLFDEMPSGLPSNENVMSPDGTIITPPPSPIATSPSPPGAPENGPSGGAAHNAPAIVLALIASLVLALL